MRDELQLMELADRYLRGELNAADHAAFEERMRTNPELRQLVEDQHALHGGMQRLALRPTVEKAYRSYKLGKWAPGIGGAAVVAVLAAGGWMLVKEHTAQQDGVEQDTNGHAVEAMLLPDTTGTGLPPLVMLIDPKADTTLITPNGLVLDIPQGAFIDGEGRAITTPVRVTMLEAIDGVDIMKAGLSTMSGDTLLETGGMFYIDAQVDGKRVGIDPEKPLTVMVPATDNRSARTPAEIPEARVRHILLGTGADEDDAGQRHRADSLLTVLKRDRSKFSELVRRFSDDRASVANGGVYEWFDRTAMVPEFTAASFDRKVGDITIAKTTYGYHIVEVLGQRTRKTPLPSSGDMMLYEGVMTDDGIVDWRNPQPLPRTLVPVDITTLDFYPPGYLAKVAELGKDATDKGYTDSLYWSFTLGPEERSSTRWNWTRSARAFYSDSVIYSPRARGHTLFLSHCASCHKATKDFTGPALKGAKARWQGKGNIYDYVRNSQAVIRSGNEYAIELFNRWKQSIMTPVDLTDAEIDAILFWADERNDPHRGIDPAKVKAIWNERFNGTNLATREFEERMREIHRTCDNAVLDLYVNNLDKDLSEIDARVGRMGHPMFDHFAERNDGRVALPEHAAERLRKVYERWSRAEAEAIRKTQAAFWTEQAEQDRKASQKHAARSMKDIQHEQERFQREFTANLANACRQLGIEKLGPRREPPITAYVANVTNPGWWNVDRAVFQSTADRKSMSFTDSTTGKTATLTYTPFTVEIADRASFEEIRVYLIPKKLNSYQRVTETDGAFTERLNSLFQYDLICMGRKDGQQYAASRRDISGEALVTITMEPTDDEGLRRMVRTPQVSASLVNDLVEQARHLEWLELEAIRQQAKRVREELRNVLLPVVFPCMGDEAWYGDDGDPSFYAE